MDLAMAQRLVDRRKAAGLSQEALAAQLDVSRQAVSKWERSESSPDTDNLIALAALYGVSTPRRRMWLTRLSLLLSTLIAAISHLSIFPSRAASTLLIPTKAKRSMLAGAASM